MAKPLLTAPPRRLVLATRRGSTPSRELHAAPGTLTALGVLGYAGSGSLASLALCQRASRR